jgi:hypothetical protein
MGVVGRDGERPCQAAASERGVDEQRASAGARQVHVGEQPPVDVAALGVEPKRDGLPVDEAIVHLVRPRSAALDGRAGLDRLGGVDADVADRLLVAVREPHVDRVAVDDVGDSGEQRAGWLGGAAALSAAPR